MSSLAEIRTALKTTMASAISGVNVYERVEDIVESPALVISLDPKKSADFSGAFARGMDEWYFHFHVFVPRRESGFPQQEIDQYLQGSGSKSIRQALFNDIGLSDTQVFVTGVLNYGAQHVYYKVPHVGATVSATVRTVGH